MKTIDIVKKYRHIFNTDYTQDANCELALLLDESSGSYIDSSPNGCSITRAGGTMGTPAVFANGWDGRDSQNDILSTDDASLDGHDSITIMCWAKGKEFTSNSSLCGKDDTKLMGHYSGGGYTYMSVLTDDAEGYSRGGDGLDEDVFKHFVGIYNNVAGDKKPDVYENGVEINYTYSQALTGTIDDDSGDDFKVGSCNVKGQYVKAFFDEVAYFSRCLDSTEINAIMDDGLRGIVANPYPVSLLRKDVITGYHCFMNAYIKAKVGEYDPLKLPDGTVF